jgi:hypothetical protein
MIHWTGCGDFQVTWNFAYDAVPSTLIWLQNCTRTDGGGETLTQIRVYLPFDGVYTIFVHRAAPAAASLSVLAYGADSAATYPAAAVGIAAPFVPSSGNVRLIVSVPMLAAFARVTVGYAQGNVSLFRQGTLTQVWLVSGEPSQLVSLLPARTIVTTFDVLCSADGPVRLLVTRTPIVDGVSFRSHSSMGSSMLLLQRCCCFRRGGPLLFCFLCSDKFLCTHTTMLCCCRDQHASAGGHAEKEFGGEGGGICCGAWTPLRRRLYDGKGPFETQGSQQVEIPALSEERLPNCSLLPAAGGRSEGG